MFFKIYLEATFFKNRSLLEHCKAIKFDLTQFVDKCMRFFLCDFLTLPAVIEFTFVFLTDGVRALYRYIYALVTVHKDFLNSLRDPKQFLAAF